MSEIKKILLFGATGRTGKLIMLDALSRGIEVVALVRSPEKITARSPKLTVIKGTPENKADVAKAFEGCDAIVGALNNNRASDMPWAKLINQPYLLRDSMQNAIDVMENTDRKRIVVMTAIGVGDSFAYAPWIIRFFIKRTNLRVVYRDHDAQEEILKKSDTDWTIVRPMILTNKDTIKHLIVSNRNQPKPAMTISRKHVAKFMVDTFRNSNRKITHPGSRKFPRPHITL